MMHPHEARFGAKVRGSRAGAPHGPRADEHELTSAQAEALLAARGFAPIAGGATTDSLTDRTEAGALMPEDVSRAIIQSLPRNSAALALFRHVSMTRKQQRLPVLSVLPTAYWVTGGDTGLKQTTEVAWRNKYLEAEEIAVIVPVPENVIDDVDYDLWGEVRPRVEEAVGLALDLAVFFGTSKPSSWPQAIVPAAQAAGNNLETGSVPNQDISVDISDVMGFIEEDGFDVNGFAAATRLKSRLRGLRATTGEIIFQPSLQADTPSTLYGENIAYVRNGGWDPTEALLVAGDYTQGIIGIRQDITVKIFTEGVISDDSGNVVLNLMQQDAAAMRVTARFAFQVANPMTRENTSGATRYPFAVLEPASS